MRPRKLGSFEEYALEMSRVLRSKGGRSILVFKELPPDHLRPLYDDAGAELEIKSFEPFGLQSARELQALIRRHRPDVVHFHFVNLLSLEVLVAAMATGTRVVFSEHSSDVARHRSPLNVVRLRAVKRLFSWGIVQVVTPSRYVLERTVHEGVQRQKCEVVYNGVALNRFRGSASGSEVRARYGVAADRTLVCSISQLIPEKGINELLEAASLALAEGHKLSFIHVGDGRFAEQYRERAARLNLGEHFVFAGLLDMPAVGAILQESDVFTLPCTWGEAFSLVILEALAAGKPIVVTSVGGNTEAVQDGRQGLVVPPHDPKALAAAFIALHTNPTLRAQMAGESLERSREFTTGRWVAQTLDVYARILRGSSNA